MKRLSAFIGLMLASICLFGQGEIVLRPLPDYDFAHFERNHLIYPSGDSMAMERFFVKMDSIMNYGVGCYPTGKSTGLTNGMRADCSYTMTRICQTARELCLRFLYISSCFEAAFGDIR